MKRIALLSAIAPLALALASCTMSNPNPTFGAALNGSNERPNPVATAGSGTVTATLRENTLTVEGTFANLSAAANAGHIHGPAGKEAAAGVLFPLVITAGTGGTISGTATLTSDQVGQLRNGQMYVNIHTPNNPGGEIRGQLELR
jgi:hypothetical protein